jgi:CubicO group peptidase (beta-lactamase class C family)
LGGGVFISARDQARIGLMLLHRGVWGSRRILSKAWIELMAEPCAGEYGFRRKAAMSCGCANSCGAHGHDHAAAWSSKLPISDFKSF